MRDVFSQGIIKDDVFACLRVTPAHGSLVKDILLKDVNLETVGFMYA